MYTHMYYRTTKEGVLCVDVMLSQDFYAICDIFVRCFFMLVLFLFDTFSCVYYYFDTFHACIIPFCPLARPTYALLVLVSSTPEWNSM